MPEQDLTSPPNNPLPAQNSSRDTGAEGTGKRLEQITPPYLSEVERMQAIQSVGAYVEDLAKKDWGENTEGTGGTRYSAGKVGGWWYGPVGGLFDTMRVANMGAEKYAPRDWYEGHSFSTLIDCAMRHTIEVLTKGPRNVDKDTGQTLSVAHIVWNWLALLHFIEDGRYDMDDVTPWFGVTATAKKVLGDNLIVRSWQVAMLVGGMETAEGRNMLSLRDVALADPHDEEAVNELATAAVDAWENLTL